MAVEALLVFSKCLTPAWPRMAAFNLVLVFCENPCFCYLPEVTTGSQLQMWHQQSSCNHFMDFGEAHSVFTGLNSWQKDQPAQTDNGIWRTLLPE